MPSSSKQRPLTSFFSSANGEDGSTRGGGRPTSPYKRQRKSIDGSHFGVCPLCSFSLPLHQLVVHASSCDGIFRKGHCSASKSSWSTGAARQPTDEPIPGLYLFEDFISEEEETLILAELDGESESYRSEFLPWKAANFNGPHQGKRWGVHCNLRDRRVTEPESPLPHFVQEILVPKMRGIKKSRVSNRTKQMRSTIELSKGITFQRTLTIANCPRNRLPTYHLQETVS